MIVGLFTELSTAGGIQRAGRLTAAALAEFAEKQRFECAFLGLNDPPQTPPFRIGSREIAFTGFGRSKSAFSAAALRAALRQPKLIVALHPHLAPLVVATKCCAPRARSIIFTHGIEVWEPLRSSRRWALRRSNLVFAPSEYTLQQLIAQQGVPENKATKLRWSQGPEFDSNAAPSTNCPPPAGFPSGRVILAVGRWDAKEAYKGVDHIILALPALLAEMPDVHLVAVGGGTDLPRLQQLAEQQRVESRVHFLPPMPTHELSAAYAACDIFALPSRGEGFGLVFLEAMSHAKPVIGGAHGGTPEIIENGVSGYLVEFGNVPQLTERLRRLLSSESARQEMGQRAFERVRSHFTYGRFVSELTQHLTSLLGP